VLFELGVQGRAADAEQPRGQAAIVFCHRKGALERSFLGCSHLHVERQDRLRLAFTLGSPPPSSKNKLSGLIRDERLSVEETAALMLPVVSAVGGGAEAPSP
jgi:hypothetical protein